MFSVHQCPKGHTIMECENELHGQCWIDACPHFDVTTEMASTALPVPAVGMGVTACVGSDRYPYTITKVIDGKTLEIQRDEYHRIDHNGLSESQLYRYKADPTGQKIIITQRNNGLWRQQGHPIRGSVPYGIGFRRAYQDPSF